MKKRKGRVKSIKVSVKRRGRMIIKNITRTLKPRRKKAGRTTRFLGMSIIND